MAGSRPPFLNHYLREIGVQTPVEPWLAAPAAGEPQAAPAGGEAAAIPSESAAMQQSAPQAMSSLDELARQAATCTACVLSEQRTQVVFGVGSPDADLVFIGEAPGRDEDLKGEPFVGRAGQLLDRMLAAVDLDRSQVYIMNTVKCRPPGNRDPRPEEVAACSRWFDAQLKLIRPKMICLLGRIAAQRVLRTESPLGALRGRWHDYHGIPVWVMYHPAYLLRSPQQKRQAWRDLCELVARYRELAG